MYYVALKNGEKLAYHKIGSGLKIIIMIHGNICSGEYLVDYAKYIKQGFTIFIPDMRGYGDSSYKNKIECIADFTSDLDDFVSCLKLNFFALLGWSAGGCICMDYAAKHPSRVWALVLIESVGIHGCPMFDDNGKAFNSIASISEEPTQIKPTLQAIKNHDIDFIKELWDSAIYIHNKPYIKQATKLAYASLKQRNLAEVYWALSYFNLSHESNGYCDGNGLYSEIRTPTLLTFGEHDKIVSRKDIERTSTMINAEELLILKNCGHSPFMDCPDFLATKLMYWLDLKFKSNGLG